MLKPRGDWWCGFMKKRKLNFIYIRDETKEKKQPEFVNKTKKEIIRLLLNKANEANLK